MAAETVTRRLTRGSFRGQLILLLVIGMSAAALLNALLIANLVDRRLQHLAQAYLLHTGQALARETAYALLAADPALQQAALIGINSFPGVMGGAFLTTRDKS